jgi:glycosyltransferase involved in cell wall biosynthesis
MKRILFVHNHLTRFVQIDRDLLSQLYAVTEHYEADPRRLRPLEMRQAVKAHDLVFCWFASWHSVLPVLLARHLRKPSVVVVGGYDTASVAEAGYGSQRGGIRKFISRTVIRHATRLLAFSEAAGREAVLNAGAHPHRTTVLYLAVGPPPVRQPPDRQPLVLTVGNVWRENLLRKGLQAFVQAAAYLPELRFVHAGRWCDDSIEELRRLAGPNVEFRGFLPDAELWDLYARTSVYVQASLHEGFGMSVAEAMSAGCIPVVTRAGSLPEVVGETGVYISSPDSRDIARGVRAALDRCGDAPRASARVQRLFSMPGRRAGLQAVVDGLTAAGAA